MTKSRPAVGVVAGDWLAAECLPFVKTELRMKRDGFIGRMGRRFGNGTRSLLSSAGKAEGAASFEALEPRVLLAADGALGLADAPGIDDVFPDTGTGSIPFELDTVVVDPSGIDPGTGLGLVIGRLDSGDTDDVFRFTATSSAFVSVLASTASSSSLDTAIEVYLPDGTELTGDNQGFSNGNLARGFASDGWHGFVAQAGQEYYVRVIGQNAADFAPSTPGQYTLKINTANTVLALDSDGVARTGSDAGDAESINSEQSDNIYRFTTGSNASLGFVLAGDIVFGDDSDGYIGVDPTTEDRDLFDSRIEVFDANGTFITGDSDSGFLYDAFTAVRFESNSTYYVRVRSDAPTSVEITDPQTGQNDDVSVGEFELRIQTRPTVVSLDPQTRVAEVDRSSSGLILDLGISGGPIDPAGLLRDQHSAQLFAFDALTSGRTFVNFFTHGLVGPNPYGQVLDATISVFDDSGSVIPFQSNDTLIPGDAWDRPGAIFNAVGGERYYVLVDVFDGVFQATGVPATDATAGQFDYRLAIESSAVLDNTDQDQRVDDHIDLSGTDEDEDGVFESIDRRVADFATPLVWGNPITPRGFIDSDYLTDDMNPMNLIPDGYLFPGLADPLLYDDSITDNSVFEVTDHSRVVQAFASGRLDTGNDTDVFMFVPQVDMLGSHAGAIDRMSGDDPDAPGEAPGQTWFLEGRPASRLTVNIFFEAEWFAFGGSAVQIYDSNFNLINEEFADPIFTVLDGSQAAGSLRIPSGIETPSLLPPAPSDGDNVDAIKPEAVVTLSNEYWAGEAYYIVVSAPLGASRYNVVVQADAFDSDSSAYAFDAESPEEGDFGNAPELVFDSFSGVATNNNNLNSTAGIRSIPVLVSDVFDEEEEIDDGMGNQIPNPNFGLPDPTGAGYYDAGLQIGQLGLIHDINDTDIFRFTAQSNGTTEILLSTTNLRDSFTELFIANALGGQVVNQNTLTKTYNSPLDAAMRVFDSNGVQIAYIDDFLGYSANGETLSFVQGNVGDIRVERKDPRLVIETERGQQYFVVVESSQRWVANAADPDAANRVAADPTAGEVDWRRATGSYQLVVNTTPNQTDNDDHADFDFGRFFIASAVPFDSDPTSQTNGTGGVSGVIENSTDTDVFEFLAPRSGIAQLTLQPQAGLSLALSLFNGDTQQIPIQPSSAIDGEPLIVNFGVSQGERYLIQVGGLNGTGNYDITLTGLPVSDDLPGEGRYAQATELSFGSFNRTVEQMATLDQAGDSEIYTFVAPESEVLTLTVTGDSSPGFSGAIEVYELTADDGGVPNFGSLVQSHALVGYDLNPDATPTVTTTVATQRDRTYFVVVRGSIALNTTGDYILQLSYNPEDDHADLGELADASFVNVVPQEGTGSITGVLEQSSDSDLFVFGAPAAGPVTVSLTWDTAPPAAFTLQLFDINGDLVDVNNDGIANNADRITGTGGTLVLPSVEASTGDIFYAAVTGPNATDIGYTLNVNTGLLDDHANEGDLSAATLIRLSPTTGDGSESGVLEVDDDTDLFTFTVSVNADVDVLIATSEITTPVLRVFNSSGALVATTSIAGGVRFTNTSGVDSVFYASVGSTFPGFQAGSYTISVDGPPAPPSPNDDHADEGDLANATVLTASSLTGDASSAGVVDIPLDSDLFRYDTLGRGTVFVQVVSRDEPSPDFTIRVFDAAGVEQTMLADSVGVAGAQGVTAATMIESGGAGETYYLLVESTGDADIGTYSIRVDGAAATTVVFYPEGFANASIQQFVTLANPNNESVDYTIRVYYADATLGSAVVASGTLAAGARGGATLSFGGDIDNDGNADFAPGIVANAAYAIAVESELRIAAGLSHYDRGILGAAQDPSGLDRTPGAIGEAFTDRLSTTWAFPDVERNPGVSEEYLVYFNPNSFSVNLTVTAFTSAGEVTLSTITLGANRRGGLEIHNTTALPLGTFAVELTAAASNPANESANLGIVASISRYNVLDSTAYGYLGVPDGGSTFNVVGSLSQGPSVSSEIHLFNAGVTATTVTITGSYQTDQGLPDLTRLVTLAAGQRLSLTGQSLAFVPNTPIGLRVSSTSAIAVSSTEVQRGDATGVAAFTDAGTSFFFGDAFMNPVQAGSLYSEALTLYNPGASDTDVSVTFLFADGTMSRTRMETVGADGFLRLQLEDVAEVVNNRPRLNFFSIQIEAESAIVAQLSHFDGFLGGGWASGGAPLGLVNSIA